MKLSCPTSTESKPYKTNLKKTLKKPKNPLKPKNLPKRRNLGLNLRFKPQGFFLRALLGKGLNGPDRKRCWFKGSHVLKGRGGVGGKGCSYAKTRVRNQIIPNKSPPKKKNNPPGPVFGAGFYIERGFSAKPLKISQKGVFRDQMGQTYNGCTTFLREKP